MTKAALTHGLSDQEGSNLDEIDREEFSVTAYEHEDARKDKTDQLQSLIQLEIKSFNAQLKSLVKCDTIMPVLGSQTAKEFHHEKVSLQR
ncbi:Uncharacterized protein HZ326_27582 [Fusarium oxysporum f. sp. albedinis]|nr:Uncharacterized protein HZ326_27582 [Fusarium oxysporum f. sp. albedinis]